MLGVHLAVFWHQFVTIGQWVGWAVFWLLMLWGIGQNIKEQNGGRYPVWVWCIVAGFAFLALALMAFSIPRLPFFAAPVALFLFAGCWLCAVVLILVPRPRKTPQKPVYGPPEEGVWPPPPVTPTEDEAGTLPNTAAKP